MFNIIFTISADKQLQRFPVHIQNLIIKKIKGIHGVYQRNNNTKKLFGAEDLYRLRVGDYRIIYQIKNDELIILILKVGHRKDVYRDV